MDTMRKARKLPEQIADKLREMIIQEEMKTGAKLPAEAELMARFGVSRSTVREAVKILQTEHIVDIRQGQGTFLCAMPGLAEDPLGLRFADQDDLIAQLLETRLLVEPGVAQLPRSSAGPLQGSGHKRHALWGIGIHQAKQLRQAFCKQDRQANPRRRRFSHRLTSQSN